VRGQRRQQAQADVGRRGPVSDGQPAACLDVVRRQEMILRAAEGLEIRPCLPGDVVQIRGIG
jgi:hypothetical protein